MLEVSCIISISYGLGFEHIAVDTWHEMTFGCVQTYELEMYMSVFVSCCLNAIRDRPNSLSADDSVIAWSIN